MTRVLEPASSESRPPSLSHRRLWVSLLRRDVATANAIIDHALSVWSPPRIYIKLLEPALIMSGRLFAGGQITYGDEHCITHQLLRLMRRVRRVWLPTPPTGPLAIGTGAGQETHLIGLRMVGDFLRASNIRFELRIANQRGVLREAVLRDSPRFVLISIGMDPGVDAARRLIAELRRIDYGGTVIIGGRAVGQDPDLVQKIGADMTAWNGLDLVRRLRRLYPDLIGAQAEAVEVEGE